MFGFNKKHVDTQITVATKHDLKNFHQLFRDFQLHHYKGKSDFFVNPNVINIDLNSYLHTIDEPNRQVFFAKKNDVAVGMVMVSIIQIDIGDLQYPRSRPTIEMLVVKEKHRREGIANKLLEVACSWAKEKGYNVIVTDVWSFSDEALQFFNKNEFNVRTRRLYKEL